jgi:thiamine kinase-like enzyme
MVPALEGKRVAIEDLKGGLTNRSFKLLTRDGSFVLRLDAEHTRMFNLDRIGEIAIVRAAAEAGLAPVVEYADAGHGILLYRFVPGETWSRADLDDAAKLDAVGELLRRVHALPPSGVRFDPRAVAQRYAAGLATRQGLHAFATHCEEIIDRASPMESAVCCHNDVVAQNIIATPALMLLDWEYACDNDALFDLASLIGFHDLDARHADALLGAYSGSSDAALRERLEEQVRIYDAVQWLWLANRHRLSPNSRQAARLEALQQRIA